MSSLVISGDTSGSVTLQAPAVSGTTILTLPSTTGTVMAPTSNGTSGQVLTSSGSATPTWATPSAGALTLLATLTPTAAANVDFLNTFSSTYDEYLILGAGLAPATGSASLLARFAVSGTVVTTPSYGSGQAFMTATDRQDSTAGTGGAFAMQVMNANSTTITKSLISNSTTIYSTPTVGNYAGTFSGASAISGIRFYWAGGQNFIAQGSIKIYGYQKA